MDQLDQSSNNKSFWARLADWLISPSASVLDVGARRQAQLLASMTLAIGTLNLVGIASTPADSRARIPSLIILTLLLFSAYGLSRTKFYYIGAWLVVIALSFYAFYSVTTPGAEIGSVLFTYLPLAFVLGLGLLSQRGLIIVVVVDTIIAFSLPSLIPTLPSNEVFGPVGIIMTLGVLLLIVNAVQISVEKKRREELINANEELQVLQSGLEQRVADRTKALETSAEVSRRLVAVLDPDQLAGEVVNQIQTAYNYYYAQIYLFDESGENLVLTAGTGDAGAAMVKRGHSLPKGRGLVGRAAEDNAPVLVADTTQDPEWLPNDLLPDTKAEAAIPIAVGDRVLGVLDVQDAVTNDITSDDITLLESLAGQVAISLQNAELYARAESAMQEAQSLVDFAAEGIAILDLETELWAEPNAAFARTFGMTREEMVQTGPNVMSPPTQPDGRDSVEKAIEMINTAMEKGSHRFEWVHTKKDGTAFDCEIGLVRMPGDRPRLRQSILDITERKRLEELNRKRAEQQTALNLISQRIQSAATIEEAMQVAARELGHALGKRQTLVALDPSALSGGSRVEVTEEAAE